MEFPLFEDHYLLIGLVVAVSLMGFMQFSRCDQDQKAPLVEDWLDIGIFFLTWAVWPIVVFISVVAFFCFAIRDLAKWGRR